MSFCLAIVVAKNCYLAAAAAGGYFITDVAAKSCYLAVVETVA
jgi:hypothetical protein